MTAKSTPAPEKAEKPEQKEVLQQTPAVSSSLPPRVILMASGDATRVTSAGLRILTILGIMFALNWAQSFMITIMLGILLSYTLNPLVERLQRIHIPRAIGATIVIAAMFCGLVFAGYSLGGQANSIITKLPEAINKLSNQMISQTGEPTNIEKVQLAASEMEKATSAVDGSSVTATKKRAMHVVVDEPKFKVNDILWRGSLGLFGLVGETAMMIFLAYFLLLSGDTFKRKMVRLAGPSLSRKKITLHIIEDINHSIQRYMLMLLITNTLVGLLSWAVFRLIGLDNAGAWAVVAGCLHLVPYFGPVAIAAATGMAAYMQFGTLLPVLLVAGASMMISTLIGVFVTTWMTGRIAKMNAAAVFISLLFWAWLWGIWGMLLGIPLTAIIKVVSERIEHLHPIAELLGE
jgi:predicted PurR-regulated permease PerM